MVVQLNKFTKNHRTIHLQWVIFMVCKWYFNKAVKKIIHTGHWKGPVQVRGPGAEASLTFQKICLRGKDRAIAETLPEVVRREGNHQASPLLSPSSLLPGPPIALTCPEAREMECFVIQSGDTKGWEEIWEQRGKWQAHGPHPAGLPPHPNAKATWTSSTFWRWEMSWEEIHRRPMFPNEDLSYGLFIIKQYRTLDWLVHLRWRFRIIYSCIYMYGRMDSRLWVGGRKGTRR